MLPFPDSIGAPAMSVGIFVWCVQADKSIHRLFIYWFARPNRFRHRSRLHSANLARRLGAKNLGFFPHLDRHEAGPDFGWEAAYRNLINTDGTFTRKLFGIDRKLAATTGEVEASSV